VAGWAEDASTRQGQTPAAPERTPAARTEPVRAFATTTRRAAVRADLTLTGRAHSPHWTVQRPTQERAGSTSRPAVYDGGADDRTRSS
jgi:hypothetical protein